ncbi:MAG: helix-turn-helix domain-containing protein, partial [Kiritimatiellae bacterium]|nr:helix-turn-helix domain-containing protein [Kiritimatiellia bacterium]
EIAHACGFYDQSHFIRTFKRIRRQTPAQYRRAHFTA